MKIDVYTLILTEWFIAIEGDLLLCLMVLVANRLIINDVLVQLVMETLLLHVALTGFDGMRSA